MSQRSSGKNKWSDHYSQKAKKEHFPARSVYKLEEIQKKFHLIKKGYRVLDLGCSPGSWLLYAANIVGESGHVTGIDIKEVSIIPPPNVTIHNGDILSTGEKLTPLAQKTYNVVLSDMAPDTTGNKIVDTSRSFRLCQAALAIAQDTLLPGGAFVCKIFQGEDFKEFIHSVKNGFTIQKSFKPQSCRKASKEIYVIGIEKK